MDAHRSAISLLVENIDALDQVERDHRAAVLDWISCGAPLYRAGGPDSPPMHLVSYFLPYDARLDEVLLVAHRKAGLDLPPGGHCDPGEMPWHTVQRECAEELGLDAVPVAPVGEQPLFVTATETRAISNRHTDVSLWHLIAVDRDDPALCPDPGEFTGARWVSLDALLAEPIERLDPHMHRFVRKLRDRIALPQ